MWCRFQQKITSLSSSRACQKERESRHRSIFEAADLCLSTPQENKDEPGLEMTPDSLEAATDSKENWKEELWRFFLKRIELDREDQTPLRTWSATALPLGVTVGLSVTNIEPAQCDHQGF